ncbi:MAG: pantetheine-phosphate adenylyltransferase [Saprospiraceae bacterium]|uniref:Phosphopantetheine adenylyltransferase n=1 Tax=Candidatus Defluviibacterium haderslevense TaxID=2981993 RepID=A0A9D7SCB2_9BACT|nr:pantetheine-phosphate adenylyltransferase [Candidatus Defluviibacterium haderslevense]MBL0236939.1 pantetheine-phosphate adenylyltransferase [Candidatus Defluviibacterium haderslevense]
MKIAVIPGSYDPITFGHIDIIRRALPLFDEVIVAIGINSQKKNLFSLDERIRWIQEIFKDEPKVKVDHFEGLTLHYCQKMGAKYLVRGIRNATDFDYERTISQIHNTIATDLETLFFIAKPELSHISSTIVRELILGGGDISAFVPDLVSVKK